MLDNPFSKRLREIVDAFRAQRSRYMKVRNHSHSHAFLTLLLYGLFIFNFV